MHTQFWSENMETEDQLGDLGDDGKIIKQSMRMWSGCLVQDKVRPLKIRPVSFTSCGQAISKYGIACRGDIWWGLCVPQGCYGSHEGPTRTQKR
jgi:hypothetical protein